MNQQWRAVLRNRLLAAVRIHRKPAGRPARPIPPTSVVMPSVTVSNAVPTQPYIHIVFKKEHAEAWMTKFESDIPKTPDNWLALHGFAHMEYFDVKVGVDGGA